MARNIVVIGGGPAAVFAALEAKKRDAAAHVTLITDEACEPYEKPPLSKAVLLGKVNPEDAPIAGPGGLAKHGITVKAGTRCTAIDRPAHQIVTTGGPLAYDSLVIATGSLMRELTLLPPGMPRVHYLRTEAHAHALKTELGLCKHLVVVGAGLIGLEVAASAAELGVEFELSTSVVQATSQLNGTVAVETSGGDLFVADVVVVGTGVKPDDTLAEAAGLEVQDGIVIDAQCRTSDPDIFAAGDCTRFPGPQGLVRLENWRHAQDHGAVAGRNAAGASDNYNTAPSFWSEQYDLYIQGVGWFDPAAHRVRRPLPEKSALMLEVKDGVISAALGINVQRDLAAIRRLIERKIPIDPAALADPARPFNAMLKARA
jgi:3-phenylpropionate/trans-cinnamate dioxygenase ferredoxin reductase subunit